MKRLQLSRQVMTLAIVIAATASQSTQAGTIKEIGVDGSFTMTTFNDPGFFALPIFLLKGSLSRTTRFGPVWEIEYL